MISVNRTLCGAVWCYFWLFYTCLVQMLSFTTLTVVRNLSFLLVFRWWYHDAFKTFHKYLWSAGSQSLTKFTQPWKQRSDPLTPHLCLWLWPRDLFFVVKYRSYACTWCHVKCGYITATRHLTPAESWENGLHGSTADHGIGPAKKNIKNANILRRFYKGISFCDFLFAFIYARSICFPFWLDLYW